MRTTQKCCVLLLETLFVGWSWGALVNTKHGCRGESVELFHNIELDSSYTVLILYVNGKTYEQIAMWTLQNSVVKPAFVNGYSKRLFLDYYDQTGEIWIHDLQDSDQGNYIIECTIKNSIKKDNVTLSVMVAPETRCKPKIVRAVDTLTTYLDSDGCGKPAATAFWMDQPGISIERNEIKLPPGQDVGTVYACIDGPALRCVRSSKLYDYCSAFQDESTGWIHSELSGLSKVAIAVLATIIAVLVVIIVISIIHFTCLKRVQKKNIKSIISEIQPLLAKEETRSQENETAFDDTGVETQRSTTVGNN
ncbi:hypothetical protein CHS0354_014891 [Potamilus streckersoni]|nr:hypothetical protein CHS0354_014891 [Potamilus streckersoni]